MAAIEQTPPVTRRRLLTAGGAAAGTAALAVAGAGGAEAAGAVVRTVTQQVPLKWTYNARTRVTTVTSFKARKVAARFVGTAISLKNSKGVWVRVPYVWSTKRKALVFSRYLQLQLAPRPSTPPTPSEPDPPSTTPYLSSSQARHVLNRAGYGVSAAGLAEVAAAGGPSAWLDKQLAPASINDSVCEAYLSRLPDQSEPIWYVRDQLHRDLRSGWDQLMSVQHGQVIRAAFSKRQLLTVMEEFWANHFNVTVPHDNIDESRAHYQWTIRTKALGSFAALLKAVTFHPAMLTYLNNRDSDAEHPNENHGRELLELHTLGVDAPYGEEGVLNAARILTGLSVEEESGEFLYKPWRHWTGAVKVLGFTHSNTSKTGGAAVTDGLLAYLARHPATARRVAEKLAIRFVSDTPSDALITKLAGVYTANDTAIVPVLRALFASSEFRASIGRKTRRPFESVIATARLLGFEPEAAGSEVDGARALGYMSEDGGQTPFGAPYPTGWPDVAAAWSSTASTLGRWNVTRSLAAGWWPTEFPRPALRARVLPATLPATHGAGVDAIAQALFGGPLMPAHRAAVLAFVGKTADAPLAENSAMVSWRLDDVVSILLDSPYHHYR